MLARLIYDRGEAGQHGDLLGGGAADLGETGDEFAATAKPKLEIEFKVA
jgi:hypothetical protein